MSFLKKTSGILGMNARNLSYIYKYNSQAHKRFADDKIFTKQFLESRGIGVAKMFHVISDYKQLTSSFFETLPLSFVLKPNKGFAGGGILVIVDKKGDSWITASGKKIDEESLYRHCISILDGKYSISGTTDKVIFEDRLDPHSSFRMLTNSGLPDVRVIVFKKVPVMAMLRVPTPESDGKANMELGAIAMGIDLGSGKTTGAALRSTYIKRLPNGEKATGFQIPFWDEILLSVAKIQQFTNIGFLGVDLVITKSGVKVLELNARPGLKIQVANKSPLKARLEKISDLKVLTAEDGVEIAKTLFAEKQILEDDFEEKPVLGVFENIILNAEEPKNILAKIDLLGENNIISDEYFNEKERILDITLEKKRLKLPVKKGKIEGADLILAGKYLTDFYIDPNKKLESKTISNISTISVDRRMLKNLDKKICELDSQIKLLSYINPRNLAEQKAVFLGNPDFSPRFFYKECDLNFASFRNELKKLPEVNHELFPLYQKKMMEIDWKLSLFEMRDSLEFGMASKEIFGSVSKSLYQEALRFVRDNSVEKDPSKEFDTKKSIEILKDFLKKYQLSHWKIKILEDSVADIQVTKKESILLKKGAKFQENRLQALLVHEIGTHVFRFENGKRQSLRILERGTAGYLKTEEGLAIWNQNNLGLELGEKLLIPSYLVIAIYMAGKMNFVDLFHYFKSTFDLSDDLAWKLCVKSKRGLKNTDLKTAFTKDSIYFSGLREIEKFVKKGGVVKDLYVGKISVSDLPLIQKIEDLVPAKFLL